MSNIWFTSDTHFGHANIVKGCSKWADISNCRDFGTIEEHDTYLIDQLNKYVKPTDILYHLGDFGLGFQWKERLPELRAKINCQTIRICLGNHDHVIENTYRVYKKFRNVVADNFLDCYLNNIDNQSKFIKGLDFKKYEDAKKIVDCFDRIDYVIFGNIGGHSMYLGHYAQRIWCWSHQGSYGLYGHSHGSLPDDPNALSIDVGMDTCLFGHEKFTPYSVGELHHIMKTFKEYKSIDHHREKII